jgi:hypothetical protein
MAVHLCRVGLRLRRPQLRSQVPFSEDVAMAYARGAFVGAEQFDSTRPNRLGPLYPTFIVREI